VSVRQVYRPDLRVRVKVRAMVRVRVRAGVSVNMFSVKPVFEEV